MEGLSGQVQAAVRKLASQVPCSEVLAILRFSSQLSLPASGPQVLQLASAGSAKRLQFVIILLNSTRDEKVGKKIR